MAHDPSLSLDLNEHGLEREGKKQQANKRLFMQLLAFDAGEDWPVSEQIRVLSVALEKARIPGVIYEDMNHPRGFGLLTWNEDPGKLLSGVRESVARADALRGGGPLLPRPGFTLFGRTYSSGFESDLEHWLIERPQATVLNPKWPWAIWYPLRRKGSFEGLDPKTKAEILREHSALGRAYGQGDLAHDIRLACYGIDPNDNDFVIGLVGPELYPLSHVVQSMRRTRQTREFIEKMGPFFVGRAVWQGHGTR